MQPIQLGPSRGITPPPPTTLSQGGSEPAELRAAEWYQVAGLSREKENGRNRQNGAVILLESKTPCTEQVWNRHFLWPPVLERICRWPPGTSFLRGAGGRGTTQGWGRPIAELVGRWLRVLTLQHASNSTILYKMGSRSQAKGRGNSPTSRGRCFFWARFRVPPGRRAIWERRA